MRRLISEKVVTWRFWVFGMVGIVFSDSLHWYVIPGSRMCIRNSHKTRFQNSVCSFITHINFINNIILLYVYDLLEFFTVYIEHKRGSVYILLIFPSTGGLLFFILIYHVLWSQLTQCSSVFSLVFMCILIIWVTHILIKFKTQICNR